MATHHLAQLNVGRLRAPMEAPETADFAAGLDPINALADGAPGFVWRLQTDDGNATGIQVSDDPLFIINMSVWESPEALREFVYRTDHRRYLQRRAEWFERMAETYLVLWWVPVGHEPSVEEALERLDTLRERGPSPEAFTFRALFPAPGVDLADVAEAEASRTT